MDIREKLEVESLDIVLADREKLRAVFPQCFVTVSLMSIYC